MWSDVWPVMFRVVCLSILLEGGVTVSNNFTKQRQNGLKSARDMIATHLRLENFISNVIVVQFFLRLVIFPYNSLYTQAVTYTTYFELGEPVRKLKQIALDLTFNLFIYLLFCTVAIASSHN